MKNTRLPKSIFIIIDDNGKIFKGSARSDFKSCRDDFVMHWLPTIKNHISMHAYWILWGCFEKAGYRIEKI